MWMCMIPSDICCVCIYGRVAMTWGSASFRDPPVRVPSALQSTTAITTYPLYPSRPSTSTDQVSQMKWSKSSLHRIPEVYGWARSPCGLAWPFLAFRFLLSFFFLPPLLMCAPSVLFSLRSTPLSSSLSAWQECWSSAPLCAPATATRALPPPSDITSSPITKVRPLHPRCPTSSPHSQFQSRSVDTNPPPSSYSGLLKCLECEDRFLLACKAVLLAALYEKFTSLGLEMLEFRLYEVKGCVWAVDATEALVIANAQFTNHIFMCVMSLCPLHRFFLHRYVLASWLLSRQFRCMLVLCFNQSELD